MFEWIRQWNTVGSLQYYVIYINKIIYSMQDNLTIVIPKNVKPSIGLFNNLLEIPIIASNCFNQLVKPSF